jgi:glycosyltransferase involved in cell wall biosynthesis
MRIAYLCAAFGSPIRGHKGAAVHVHDMVTAPAAQGLDVRDGQSGLVCPPGDVAALCSALLRMAHDAGLRARLGAAARREAERHTWSENARIVAHVAAALSLDRRAPTMMVLAARSER